MLVTIYSCKVVFQPVESLQPLHHSLILSDFTSYCEQGWARLVFRCFQDFSFPHSSKNYIDEKLRANLLAFWCKIGEVSPSILNFFPVLCWIACVNPFSSLTHRLLSAFMQLRMQWRVSQMCLADLRNGAMWLRSGKKSETFKAHWSHVISPEDWFFPLNWNWTVG